MRLGGKQAPVQGCGLADSCLFFQRFGIERPGKGRILRLCRHGASVRFYLVQACNSLGEPGGAELWVKRGCAREFPSRRCKPAHCKIGASQRKGRLRVSLIDLLRFDEKWNRLLRFAGALIVNAKKQIGNI